MTKTYTVLESFIWKGGDPVRVGDEIELTDLEARPLLHQGRVVVKQTPPPVVEEVVAVEEKVVTSEPEAKPEPIVRRGRK